MKGTSSVTFCGESFFSGFSSPITQTSSYVEFNVRTNTFDDFILNIIFKEITSY